MADSFKIGQGRTADGAAVLLSLSGELDINSRDELHDAVLAAVSTGDVIVDLQAVSFIDSEALSALIDGYNAARERGSVFRVVKATGLVDRVLSVSGALDLFGH